MRLGYEVRMGILPVFSASLTLAQKDGDASGYRLDGRMRSLPMFARFFEGILELSSSGSLQQSRMTPDLFRLRVLDPEGKSLPGVATTVILYEQEDGGAAPRRDSPAPRSAKEGQGKAGSLDPAAALLQLIMARTQDGRCPDSLAMFDGWREIRVTLSPLKPGNIPPNSESLYSGPVEGCAFSVIDMRTGKPPEGTGSDYLRFLRTGKLWFASSGQADAEQTAGFPVLLEAGGTVSRIRLFLASAAPVASGQ